MWNDRVCLWKGDFSHLKFYKHVHLIFNVFDSVDFRKWLFLKTFRSYQEHFPSIEIEVRVNSASGCLIVVFLIKCTHKQPRKHDYGNLLKNSCSFFMNTHKFCGLNEFYTLQAIGVLPNHPKLISFYSLLKSAIMILKQALLDLSLRL